MKKMLCIESVNNKYDESELEKALGGSETIFLFLVRELKKRVELDIAFRNTPIPDKKYDVVMSYRSPSPLFYFKKSKNVLYLQDLPSEEICQQINRLMGMGLLHKCIFLSHYQKEMYLYQCPMLDENRHVIMLENGLDLDLFKCKVKKEKAFLYASTPYRGLDVLLKVWPKIHKSLPDWELRIAGNVNMYSVSSNSEEHNKLQNEINAVGNELYGKDIPGIKWLGGLKHSDLVKEMKRCKGLLYPCTFPETSCHTLNCALHAGCSPFVSTAGGAVSEKVCHNENGVIIPGDPKGEEFQKLYIEHIIETVKSGRIDRLNKVNEGQYKAWGMERLTKRLVDLLFDWDKVEGVNHKILGVTVSLYGSKKKAWNNLLWYNPYDLMTEEIVGLPVDQARNAACSMTIYKGADWLLFLDDDIRVRCNFLTEMMKRYEETDCEIIVANYFLKNQYISEPVTRIVRKFDNKAIGWNQLKDLTEEQVNSPEYRFIMGGAGALLISTKVLKKMGRPWFRTTATMSGRHTGEDNWFFSEARFLDIPIWVAWDIPVAHVDEKNNKWYGRPEDIELIKDHIKNYKKSITYRKEKI